ncbi:MAG: histidine kinase [Deltaproteobacteria bacterium]|nr:histidine kinase [Deltaproteobacteria bacterium]
MRTVVPTVLRATLFSFLMLSSAAILYTMVLNARTIRSLAESSLESTALALSVSAESSLRSSGDRQGGGVREILSDRVVAFALIADANGKILFHTNPGRVGRSLGEEDLQAWLRSGRPYGQRITLGTGLPAYEYNYILHRPGGGAELLRLVLQTARADLLLAGVRRMWWAVGAVLVILWGIGIILERVLTRQLRLQEETGRRERLALIGQMTATLSHEIRNALGSVKGYTQWVDEKIRIDRPLRAGRAAGPGGNHRLGREDRNGFRRRPARAGRSREAPAGAGQRHPERDPGDGRGRDVEDFRARRRKKGPGPDRGQRAGDPRFGAGPPVHPVLHDEGRWNGPGAGVFEEGDRGDAGRHRAAQPGGRRSRPRDAPSDGKVTPTCRKAY